MEKQELIEWLNNKLSETLKFQQIFEPLSEGHSGCESRANAYMTAINYVDQLDEPQKVKVPAYVAEWIEQAKKERQSLYEAMWNIESITYYHKYDNAAYQWMFEGALHDEHQELFTEAYMHGYEVEEEPRWIVKYIPPFIDDFRYYSMDDEIFDITESSWTSDKEDAYPFTEKEKAEAVALLVDGSVEEV